MPKTIIYQLLPRLYANKCADPVRNGTITQNGSGKLNDIDSRLLRQIRQLGVTDVWYTGVIEHAHDTDYTAYGIPRHNPHVIKGHAGSPYAITDYYDIDPDLAVDVEKRMAEFEALVKRTHDAGMRVIIDFVPNHVARQYHSDAKPRGIKDLGEDDNVDMFFSPSNNFYYITRQQFRPEGVDMGSGDDAYVEFPAKASGNDCFTAFPGRNDWYDTAKLNYGVDPWNGSKHFDPIPPTWFKMLHILRYWARKGVDGFRCDMVHMVPVEFWHWAIAQVKEKYPHVRFIAEIYDVGLYRPYIDYGGFDYLYDKVNLYDTLYGIVCHHLSAANITSCWQTVEGIAPHMLNFLENHDEVRYASRFYAGDATHVLPALVVSSMINTGPMMIYGGQELGERGEEQEGYSGLDGRTSIFDYWNIPTVNRWLATGGDALASPGTLPSGSIEPSATPRPARQCRVPDPESSATPRPARQCRVPDPAMLQLRDMYARVLTLCNKEAAISDGAFFDLMYVNYSNPDFSPHSQYAFLRYHQGQTLLICVNFADTAADVKINIPEHAFDYLGIAPGKYRCTNLLGGEVATKTVAPDSPFTTAIPAYGAVIWKFNKKKPKNSVKK